MSKKVFLKFKFSSKAQFSLMLASLFIISFAFIYFLNKEIFPFQENRVLFIFSKDYFQKFTASPGGLLEYAGNFITQVYHKYALGAMILSLFFILLCVILLEYNKRLSVSESSSSFFILIPASLLFLSLNNFNCFAHYTLGYLAVLIYFLLTVQCEKNRFSYVFLALNPLLYYALGFFAFVYCAIYIHYIIMNKKGNLRYCLPFILILYIFLTFVVFKELLFLQPVNILLFNPLIVYDHTNLPLSFSILIGYSVMSSWLINNLFLSKVILRYSLIITETFFLTFITVILLLFFKQNNDSRLN